MGKKGKDFSVKPKSSKLGPVRQSPRRLVLSEASISHYVHPAVRHRLQGAPYHGRYLSKNGTEAC